MALASLVSLAAQGDGEAFRDLVEPHVAAALGHRPGRRASASSVKTLVDTPSAVSP
jgi:hypothetical protein